MKKFILSLSLLALLPMIGHAAQIQPPVFNGNAVSGNVNQYQFENLSLVGAPNNYRMELVPTPLVHRGRDRFVHLLRFGLGQRNQRLHYLWEGDHALCVRGQQRYRMHFGGSLRFLVPSPWPYPIHERPCWNQGRRRQQQLPGASPGSDRIESLTDHEA